jgi:hypothetical protein
MVDVHNFRHNLSTDVSEAKRGRSGGLDPIQKSPSQYLKSNIKQWRKF